MKKIFLSVSLALLIAAGLAGLQADAQQKQAPKKDQLGEYDEVIIKRKGDKDGKVTVEIKDGEVWVNGQKLNAFKDDNIMVFRRRIRPQDGNLFSFRNFGPRGGLQFFDNDDLEEDPLAPGNKALLGVVTQPAEKGARIAEVSEKSPAEKAGLKKGDIITRVDDQKIENPADLVEAIGHYKPGDKVTITYLRDQKENKITVTLDERKDAMIRSFSFGPDGFNKRFRLAPGIPGTPFGEFNYGSHRERLGVSVQDTEEGKGVKVLEVLEGSIADKAGIQKNDIITEWDGKKITTTRALAEAYRNSTAPSKVTVTIERNGKSQTLSIKLPQELHKMDL